MALEKNEPETKDVGAQSGANFVRVNAFHNADLKAKLLAKGGDTVFFQEDVPLKEGVERRHLITKIEVANTKTGTIPPKSVSLSDIQNATAELLTEILRHPSGITNLGPIQTKGSDSVVGGDASSHQSSPAFSYTKKKEPSWVEEWIG